MGEESSLRYRVLGRTNLKVSEIGFGGIPIQKIGLEAAVRVVEKALDLGVNYIDTARAYTDSEEKIGRAIKGRRDECYLATKTNKRVGIEVKKDLDESLRMLNTSRLDVYQLHNVSDERTLEKVLETGGALQAVKRARAEGRVDYIGITGHRSDILVEAIQTNEFDLVLIPFNYVETEAATELIPLANKLNVGIVVMKPMGGGAFTKASAALRFVLGHSVSTVVPGMGSTEEVDENVNIIETMAPLSAAELEDLARQSEEIGKTFCRNCGYCQPCPQDVPVPFLTRINTLVKRMGLEGWYARWGTALEKYENCTQCRECEEKCPYELPVLELMAKQVDWLKKACRDIR